MTNTYKSLRIKYDSNNGFYHGVKKMKIYHIKKISERNIGLSSG